MLHLHHTTQAPSMPHLGDSEAHVQLLRRVPFVGVCISAAVVWLGLMRWEVSCMGVGTRELSLPPTTPPSESVTSPQSHGPRRIERGQKAKCPCNRSWHYTHLAAALLHNSCELVPHNGACQQALLTLMVGVQVAAGGQAIGRLSCASEVVLRRSCCCIVSTTHCFHTCHRCHTR